MQSSRCTKPAPNTMVRETVIKSLKEQVQTCLVMENGIPVTIMILPFLGIANH